MIVVSVASGTSADGLDVGVVDLQLGADGVIEAHVVDTWAADWPAGLRERLLALLPPSDTTARELALVDTAVGQAVATAAADAVRVAEERTGQRPELVVSPGQTVHHEVVGDRCLGTLQLGQPAWVAEATGLPVVSDLRARDVAAGGHGAPLAGVLDGLWLAGAGGPRVALNLGGIANVTVVGEHGAEAAWDTGPANCLLDVASARATDGRQSHDADGALARAGRVHPELLAALQAHPYFELAPPKSTGRETFSAAYLDQVLDGFGDLPWADVLATLVELTAVTVADAVRPYAPTEVVASGGGTANPALVAALARRLDGTPLRVSDELGLPARGKEAVLWALLGFLTWYGVPRTTGPHPARILGRISPGAGPLVLPPPATKAPTRLTVRTSALTGGGRPVA
jgi:anhydro-N-acetylmuramic acid kinase